MTSRYEFDPRSQLTSIVKFDKQGHPNQIEQKFWGTTPADAGRLLAKSTTDAKGSIQSYQAFNYDKSGNIVEKRAYSDLSEGQQLALQVSPKGELINGDKAEEQFETFSYSNDGLNLLVSKVDHEGNQTVYLYEKDTNLPLKEIVYEKGELKKKISYKNALEDNMLLSEAGEKGQDSLLNDLSAACNCNQSRRGGGTPGATGPTGPTGPKGDPGSQERQERLDLGQQEQQDHRRNRCNRTVWGSNRTNRSNGQQTGAQQEQQGQQGPQEHRSNWVWGNRSNRSDRNQE